MKHTDFVPYLQMSPAELRKCNFRRGWALSFIGLIVYGVLRLFRRTPKDFHGICKYFEIGKGWGGFEMGWFFVCSKDAGEITKCHEVGHSIQNAAVGGLRMVGYCIASACRYWFRCIFGAKTRYDRWFFEGDATSLGKWYVQNIDKIKGDN